MFPLVFLATLAAAAPATRQSSSSLALPILFKYGGYPRITADIQFGTPAQTAVETIVDTGSMGYWVYGPNSTINDGSQYLGVQGPCNKTVTKFYNWPASTSAEGLTEAVLGYSYGGNGKLVSGDYTINDTLSFANTKWSALPNQMVGLTDFTIVRELDENCAIPESNFDHSILGLYPPVPGAAGIYPAFRDNAIAQNPDLSSSFSMWFDEAPASVEGTFEGTLLLGALPPKDKYTGDLVLVNATKPADTIGYYVSLPTMLAAPLNNTSAYQKVAIGDDTVTDCLVDSGTGTDSLPITTDSFVNITGLVEYEGYVAYNGSCDAIPAAAALRFAFAGLNGGSVNVDMPLRNYARGQTYGGEDNPGKCILSLTLDNYGGCVLGAPFFSAAMIAFNDSPYQIAMAQGGVSTGQEDGISGLGDIVVISKGQGIPGAI